VQRHTAPADVHNCRRIDSQCQPKIFQEPRSEVPQPVSPSSELCLQRAPADLVCSVEHVQSVGKPAINVQRKTACPLSRGPEPINLAIPDAPRVALVLAPVKHAVRRFAVAFGHA